MNAIKFPLATVDTDGDSSKPVSVACKLSMRAAVAVVKRPVTSIIEIDSRFIGHPEFRGQFSPNGPAYPNRK